MIRFESPPVRILLLFIAVSSLVSIGLIFFIRMEEESRLRGTLYKPRKVKTELKSVVSSTKLVRANDQHQTLFNTIRQLFGKFYLIHGRDSTLHSQLSPRLKRGTRRSGENSKTFSDFHRIRHAMKRLDRGGLEEDLILRMILDSIPPQVSHAVPNTAQEDGSAQLKYYANEQKFPSFVKEESTKAEFPTVDRKNEVSISLLTTTRRPFNILYEFEPKSIDKSLNSNVKKEHRNNRSHFPTNSHNKSKFQDEVCYGTEDVLIVIAVTCSLNFAFVLVIWACVKWFSNSKEEFKQLRECEESGESVLFPLESDDFWSTSGKYLKHSSQADPVFLTTRSMYMIRTEPLPGMSIKANSYSMEDLRYAGGI